MKINYDPDYQKVISELENNFGWSETEQAADRYKDLINDTIRAVKNIKSKCTCKPDETPGATSEMICNNCEGVQEWHIPYPKD